MRYVAGLVAPDTVNTVPAATLQAIADHGIVHGDTIRGSYDVAWDTLDELGRGIDMADVADSLERQGVATFHQEDLIQSVTAELKNQGARRTPRVRSGLSQTEARRIPSASFPHE
jgi:transaldolase